MRRKNMATEETTQEETSSGQFKLPIRAYLMYLFVLAFLMTGITLSKYVTSTGGDDSARTTTFGDIKIEETMESTQRAKDGSLLLVPGMTLTKKAELSFTGSETATYILLGVKADGWTTDDGYTFCKDTNTSASTKSDEKKISWSIDVTKWVLIGKPTDTQTLWAYAYRDDKSATASETISAETPSPLAANTSLTDVPIIKDGQVTVGTGVTSSALNALAGNAALSITFRAAAVQSDGSTPTTDTLIEKVAN